MALTKTDIVNMALTKVGASPIISIDDETNNARIINRTYEICLKSVLAECQWNFATVRVNLTQIVDSYDFYDTGETYVYAKPTDLIRIFAVNPPTATLREEGDYLISDTEGVGIKYTSFLDTPSKYPIYFVEALVDRIAADISYAIVNSASLAEAFNKRYETVSLVKAKTANSQTGVQQVMKADAWELAKYQDNQPDA